MTRLPRYVLTLGVLLVLALIDAAAGGTILSSVDQPLRDVLPSAAGAFLTVLLVSLIVYGLVGWVLDVVADTITARDRIPEVILRWDDLMGSASTAWTRWFFVPLWLLVILALPGSVAGQIPALLWPGALLLVWSLPGNPISPPGRLPQRGRSVQSPAPDEGIAPSTLTGNIVEFLRQSPGYRGQITVVKTRAAQAPEYYEGKEPLYAAGSPARYALPLPEGQSRLYTHQGYVAKLLSQRRTVALATALGSGRMSIVLPVILDRVLSKGSTVLVLAPDAAACQAGYDHLKRTMTRTRWQWSVVMTICRDVTEADTAATSDPQIVFATFEVAHQRLLPDASTRWSAFFSGIDLLVTLRTERLSGVYGANCAMVLRRLTRVCRAHGAKPQLLALLRPVANAHVFLTSLFGETFDADSVLTEDTAPSAAQTVLFWNAGEMADMDRSLTRNDYAAEARNLAVQLTAAGRHTLMYAGAVPLTAADVGTFQHAMLHVPVVQEMSDKEFGGKFHSFDTVVLTGAPGPFTLLHHDLAHLNGGASGTALICIVPPHQPLAQYFVRRPDLFFELTDLPEVALTLENTYVVRKHLLAAAAEQPLSEDDVTRYFGAIGQSLIADLLHEHALAEEESRRAEDRRLVTIKGYHVVDRQAPDWPLDTASSAMVWLVNAQTHEPLRRIDASTANSMAYQGAVLSIGGDRFQVDRRPGDLAGGKILLQPGVTWLGSSSIRNLVLRPLDTAAVRHQLDRIDGGLQFTIRMGPIEIEETITGVHHYDGSALNGRLQFNTTTALSELTSRIATQGVLISFEEVEPGPRLEHAVHTLAHLGSVVLPLLLTCGPDDIGVGYVGHVQTAEGVLPTPALLFFDAVPGGNGATQVLRDQVHSFFQIAYDILASCACENGCTACIHIVQCHSVTPNADLDKHTAKHLLAQVLNLDQPPDTDATLDKEESLQIIRSKVLEQLQNRLGMRIAEPAPVRFFDKTEAALRIDGLFYSSPLQVAVRHLGYARTMAVLAHEYTHNWQAEPGTVDPRLRAKSVPFDGKLFIEGFAQWVEYKLHDVFGFDDDAERLAFTNFDEYSEGFLLFRQLEDAGGVDRVLTFLRQPDDPATWAKLYHHSGISDRALSRWKELKDAGQELPQDDWESMSTFDENGQVP